jgi:hypothetical protein
LAATLVASISALVLGWLAGSAGADGDPASDVLASQSLFLPQDAGVSARQQVQLLDLLAAAQRSGFQIRVAVIASSTDLGSVTALWRRPQSYAQFLGQELSLVYRGPLLVIMPAGFGFYWLGHSVAAERSALAGLQTPPAASLGSAGLEAIQRLAGASGHALAIPSPALSSGPGSFDALPWIVFAIGGVLIAAAWTASLRAQPLRSRGGRMPPA